MLEDIDCHELPGFKIVTGYGSSGAPLSQASRLVGVRLLAKAETAIVELVGHDQLALDILHLVRFAELIDSLVAVKAYCCVSRRLLVLLSDIEEGGCVTRLVQHGSCFLLTLQLLLQL